MNDGLPLLEDFITWDGRCALCAHRSKFSSWCYVYGMIVSKDDTCGRFKKMSDSCAFGTKKESQQ